MDTALKERSQTADAATAHMLAAQRGDSAAFETVYSLTVEEIERFVSSRAHIADTEDIVADTFVRAFRSCATYNPGPAPVVAWIKTIAKNVIRSHYKRASRRPAIEAVVGEQRTATSSEELALHRDDSHRVVQAMNRLAPRQRRVLELRFVLDLPVATCAEALDLSDEAVRALTYRSLKALKAEFVASGGTIK